MQWNTSAWNWRTNWKKKSRKYLPAEIPPWLRINFLWFFYGYDDLIESNEKSISYDGTPARETDTQTEKITEIAHHENTEMIMIMMMMMIIMIMIIIVIIMIIIIIMMMMMMMMMMMIIMMMMMMMMMMMIIIIIMIIMIIIIIIIIIIIKMIIIMTTIIIMLVVMTIMVIIIMWYSKSASYKMRQICHMDIWPLLTSAQVNEYACDVLVKENSTYSMGHNMK